MWVEREGKQPGAGRPGAGDLEWAADAGKPAVLHDPGGDRVRPFFSGLHFSLKTQQNHSCDSLTTRLKFPMTGMCLSPLSSRSQEVARREEDSGATALDQGLRKGPVEIRAAPSQGPRERQGLLLLILFHSCTNPSLYHSVLMTRRQGFPSREQFTDTSVAFDLTEMQPKRRRRRGPGAQQQEGEWEVEPEGREARWSETPRRATLSVQLLARETSETRACHHTGYDGHLQGMRNCMQIP